MVGLQSMTDASTQRPMFIIFGYPRSGNTLLGALLNVNDEIVVPAETDFIVPACAIFRAVPDAKTGRRLIADLIVNTERFPYSLAPYVSPQALLDEFEASEYTGAGIVQAVYRVVAKAAGKSIAGDRSPMDISYIPEMNKAGVFKSDIRVIHLVRDPRDVYLSTLKANWLPEEELRANFPRVWAGTNLNLRRLFSAHPERYIRVRYEDLIGSPETELRRVCDFLQVPFQPKMLDPATRTGIYQNDRHHVNVSRELLPSRIGVHHRELAPEVAAEIARGAREALQVFGYQETAAERQSA